MLTLSETEILSHIRRREPFKATLEGGSLRIKVDKYLPSICTAIHQGHRLRNDLAKQCALNNHQRLYEEDPATDALISSLPITLIARDSRYEYDLNRPLALAIYQRAWGQQVWAIPLRIKQVQSSHNKHRQFYRILDALIEQLEQQFDACILFDIHSYNYQRIKRQTPTFNLGTEQIDMNRWRDVVDHFEQGLNTITLSDLQVSATQNDVFFGRGYLIGHVNSRFVNTLVIPTEVKKIYMDEKTGTLFPLILNELKKGMRKSIRETTTYFFTQVKLQIESLSA